MLRRPDVHARSLSVSRLAPVAFVLSLLPASVFAQSFPGGFLQHATSTASRPPLTRLQIQAFLPIRGGFTFPSPYNTRGARLTTSTDCSGADCVNYVGYSYWRNINNHVGSDTMLIFLGLDRSRGGTGPTLFSYNKVTEEVRNLGPLFDAASPHSWATGEGWYFSATRPTTLYLNDGAQLLRYDVMTKQFQTVFDVGPQYGTDKAIWQTHSSNDDVVHSATLQNGSGASLGCVVYREDTRRFSFFPATGGFDECQVDKSGRWLTIKEQIDGHYGEDVLIIDLQAGTQTVLLDQNGAPGHSDTGYGYMVGADNWNAFPNAWRLWTFGQNPLQGPLVYVGTDWTSFTPAHVSHSNAKAAVAPQQQYACGSAANRVTAPFSNEIVCFRLDGSLDVLVAAPVMTSLDAPGGGSDDYAKMPKGNLDVTGQYFVWTSNTASNRLDAFIVKVPSQLLVASTTDTTPPTVSILTPPAGTTVAGTTAVSAQTGDNAGVAGVQFKLDGANLGSEMTAPPYALAWTTTTVLNGGHTLTAVARDRAGNRTTSAAISVIVANGDKIPPAVAVISPLTGSAVSGTVTVSATATDNVGVSGVQFKVDGVNLGSEMTTRPYSLSWNTRSVGNGSHSLTAVARDAAGDSTVSVAVGVSVRNDLTPPLISLISSSDTSSGATIAWTTNEPSDSQVEYGPTTTYGTVTTLDRRLLTAHSQTLSGLTSGTLYHYRVKSRDVAGSLATSGDLTFKTSGPAPRTRPSVEDVVWANVVNAAATGSSLTKTSGCNGCADAGGTSSQLITSGKGYVEFTATETTKLRWAGLSHGNAGTGAGGIGFAVRLQSGIAEVRESGVYRADTRVTVGDVFRVGVQSGVVRYYKNGVVFYTSTVAAVYPLLLDASLADLGATVANAKIARGL